MSANRLSLPIPNSLHSTPTLSYLIIGTFRRRQIILNNVARLSTSASTAFRFHTLSRGYLGATPRIPAAPLFPKGTLSPWISASCRWPVIGSWYGITFSHYEEGFGCRRVRRNGSASCKSPHFPR
jgi:hypothetical protein